MSATALRVGYVERDAPDPSILHRGLTHNVGCYLVETDDGIALFDCGPTTCMPALKAGLADRGLELGDVSHLLLSHIHFDHAGATGALVRENPSLQVHVSAVGAPHLVDPSRLEASARRLYGDTFDPLWGELVPVPAENIRIVGDDVLGLRVLPEHRATRATTSRCCTRTGPSMRATPMGVRIAPASFVLAPTPPPDIDLEAWEATIVETERREPARLALTHFGVFEDVPAHLARLRSTLHRWSDRVAHGMDQETFVAAARADCFASDPDEVEEYDQAAPVLPVLPRARALLAQAG